MMVTGGCYCGRVRYEISGVPFHSTICHCRDCRRVAASPMVAWFTVASAELRFVAGEPKRFPSSANAERGFCSDCGTPLTFQRTDLPAEIDVTTCSLDNPEYLPPHDHTWTDSGLSWVRINDGLTHYPASRSEA